MSMVCFKTNFVATKKSAYVLATPKALHDFLRVTETHCVETSSHCYLINSDAVYI